MLKKIKEFGEEHAVDTVKGKGITIYKFDPKKKGKKDKKAFKYIQIDKDTALLSERLMSVNIEAKNIKKVVIDPSPYQSTLIISLNESDSIRFTT